MPRSVVEVRPVEPGDAAELVAHLREQDRAEVAALGYAPADAVAVCLSRADWSRTALVDGRVACMFGVAPMGGLLDARGVPWMLGTDLVPQNRRALARLAPQYIRTMLQTYPHLLNVVHAPNTVAVRWLERSGFSLGEPFDFNGQPFRRFELKAA